MKAEPDRWQRLPFGDVNAIPYARDFDGAEYQRLELGLIPRAMEDKWFIYMQESQLNFHRSWTGKAVYRLILGATDEGYKVVEALCSRDVLDLSDSDYQVKLLDFLISNLLLGEAKSFPRPTNVHEPMPGALQHAISGTGYRETIITRKPWWRLWR